MIECTACGGRGGDCKVCGGMCRLIIKGCFLELIPSQIWMLLKLIDLYEKGLPPVAGGSLDQAKNFIDAAAFVMSEKSYWENRRGNIFNMGK